MSGNCWCVSVQSLFFVCVTADRASVHGAARLTQLRRHSRHSHARAHQGCEVDILTLDVTGLVEGVVVDGDESDDDDA